MVASIPRPIAGPPYQQRGAPINTDFASKVLHVQPARPVARHVAGHGLGTALSVNGVSPETVQAILRHTGIQTTFRYYVNSEVGAQRDTLAAIGTNVPIGATIRG